MGVNPKSIDDMEIYSVIKKLNSFDYVQTILCCSGHEAWQKRTNHNPSYVEYKFSDQKGVELASYILEALKKEEKRKTRSTGSMVPKLEVYQDNSLKIRGTYAGDFKADPKTIQSIVMDFWTAMEIAIDDFKAKMGSR